MQELYKKAVRNGQIFNGGQMCDTWDGPCSCGAWHKPSEAESRLRDNGLLEKAVPPKAPPTLRLVPKDVD